MSVKKNVNLHQFFAWLKDNLILIKIFRTILISRLLFDFNQYSILLIGKYIRFTVIQNFWSLNIGVENRSLLNKQILTKFDVKKYNLKYLLTDCIPLWSSG